MELRRIGIVVHPKRPLEGALHTLREWTAEHDAELVQIRTPGSDREVAEAGEARDCDLVVAAGGDGTALAALQAAAAVRLPVLGVACGSLGALTAVTAPDLRDALDRVRAGGWTPKHLYGLHAEQEGEEPIVALNDLVVIRAGASQVAVSITVDDDLYVRFAGDGVVAATPLGSSAYTMAAGGPVMAAGATGIAVTPLAPHGGCCPPLLAGPEAEVVLDVEPGHAGARIEVDGRPSMLEHGRLVLRLVEAHATLIRLDDGEAPFAGLRRRRILMDSPRLLARDDRARQPAG